MPPLPYHPFPDLPTEALGERTFLYDDSKVDYKTLREEAARQAALSAEKDGPQGGSSPQCLESSGGLRLSLPTLTGTNVLFSISNAEPGGIFDLFISTNLASTNAWSFAFRTAPGQTNFQIALPAGNALTFMLGTTLDTDGDSLSDAFENLVSHTDPQTRDTVQTAGANAWLAGLLTERPHEKRLAEVHWKYDQTVLNNPCDLGEAFSRQGALSWTNGIGGLQSETTRVGDCDMTTHLPAFTNYFSEVYWQSNDSWCIRFRTEDGPWSECGPDPDGQTRRSPRESQWAYRKTTNLIVNTGMSPPLTNRVTDDYQVKIEIDTGGKPMSVKQRLYAVTVRAWADGIYVSPELITVAGRTLNTNYTAFFLWSDNTINDVTPHLPASYTNYNFTVEYDRADPKIYFDSLDWTDNRPTAWIGQRISLVCRLEGEVATEIAAITNYLWNIQGNFVSNWVATAQTGKVYWVNNFTNADITYHYWKPGTDLEARCSVKVEGYDMIAKTTFTVLAPPGGMVAQILNTVKVDNNWDSNPQVALHFGDLSSPAGIRFTRSVQGDCKWLQLAALLRRVKNSDDGKWARLSGTGLDGGFPYPVDELNFHVVDTPGFSLSPGLNEATASDQFQMFLMFRPGGEASVGAIYVPIARVGWGWGGDAVLQDGLWSMIANGASATVDQSPSEPAGFPEWISNVNDFIWVEE